MTVFDISLKWGRWGETVATEYLKQEGWYVVQAADIRTERGGPRAIAEHTSSVLPDLLALKGGISRWCEIKVKDSPIIFRNNWQPRHGIDTPYWDHYLTVERESGIDGYLYIIELSEMEGGHINPHLLVQSIRILSSNIASPNGILSPGEHGKFPYGGTFWARGAFELLGNLPKDPPLILGETIKAKIHGWTKRPSIANQDYTRRCICRGCGKPVPITRPDRLCDEHYAPVSDEAVNRWIAWRLKEQSAETKEPE